LVPLFSSDDGSDYYDSRAAASESYAPQTIREIISPPACYKQRVFGVVDILCMEDTSKPEDDPAHGVTFADEKMAQELVARSGSDDGSASSIFSSNPGSDCAMSSNPGGSTLGTVQEEFSTTSSRSNQISHEISSSMSNVQLNNSNPQAHEAIMRSDSWGGRLEGGTPPRNANTVHSHVDMTSTGRAVVPTTSLPSLSRGRGKSAGGSDYSESDGGVQVQ
jgi:hypothetical protein